MALGRPNNKLNYIAVIVVFEGKTPAEPYYLKIRLEPYEKLQNTRGVFL